MILFLLIPQIPKIYPMLSTTTGLLISLIIMTPGCVSFRQRIRTKTNVERKLITLLPKLLHLREKLQHTNIAQNNDQTDDEEEYDNEWVVEIVGGPEEAKNIARVVGYKYIAPVRGFDNVYIFSKESCRGKRKADSKSTLALRRHKHVLWAEQQRVHKRFKRDHIGATAGATNDTNQNNIFFNDPFWPEQWNLKSLKTINGQPISMNVIKAWELGYTGKGVVVTVLDDGIQHNHTDIASNYDPQASYDLNDNDPDPMPILNKINGHGTRCAGEIAMAPNNSFCGTTTDIGNKCTGTFAGTSASSPMAAAIIALGLDANPSLTWRDVQHIVVWTSDPVPLLNINEGWTKNARGLFVNSRFGFGLMDASAFVKTAKTWQNVPEHHACITTFPTFLKREINDEIVTVVKFHTDACEGQKNEINFLEHVQLILDAYYPIRGHLSISIISPK
ncbi:peptidase, S8/S53 family, partial [Onchocerca flexuosa]